MGFLPLTWLAASGERRAMWWWLAAAFGVSGVADILSYGPHPLLSPWLMATVYPVSQAGIVILAVGRRKEAKVFTWLLVAVGLVTVLTEGVTGPTLLLETFAAAAIIAVVVPLPLGLLRLTLLTAFGVGFLAWVGYVIAPGWTTWSIYQGVRALSLVMFCWASLQTRPLLRVA